MERRARDISGKHASVLRRINSIQVFNALRLKPGISQRDIGGFTGIDRSTVSAIITYFDELGLLNRDLDDSAGRRGRPSESLSLRAEAGLLVGIHIEPSSMLFVASGLDGTPFATQEAPPLQNAGEIERAVEAGLHEFYRHLDRSGDDVRAIGICVPGLISTHGILTESSNFKWQNIDLQQIANRIGPHVHVGNDSRGAGLAEKLFGKCVEVEDYIYLDSASGVGGILFLDGHAYTGASGFAGEMGHVKIVPNGRLCQCGSLGCISAYVSEPALVERFSQLGLHACTFSMMQALASAGSTQALAVLDEAGEMLGIALADYINLFNPPTIVLGGGFAVLAPFMMQGIERSIARLALLSPRNLCTLMVSDLALQDTPRGGLALALSGLTNPAREGPFPW